MFFWSNCNNCQQSDHWENFCIYLLLELAHYRREHTVVDISRHIRLHHDHHSLMQLLRFLTRLFAHLPLRLGQQTQRSLGIGPDRRTAQHILVDLLEELLHNLVLPTAGVHLRLVPLDGLHEPVDKLAHLLGQVLVQLREVGAELVLEVGEDLTRVVVAGEGGGRGGGGGGGGRRDWAERETRIRCGAWEGLVSG